MKQWFFRVMVFSISLLILSSKAGFSYADQHTDYNSYVEDASFKQQAEKVNRPDTLIINDEIIYEKWPKGCIESYRYNLSDSASKLKKVKDIVSPNYILGYSYIDDTAKVKSQYFGIIDQYEYIYGTTIYVKSSGEASYEFTRKLSRTVGSDWHLDAEANANFNVAMVKADVKASAGRSENKTVSVEQGEKWAIGSLTAGTHRISFWMRGHKFDIEADFVMHSTDCNDGKTYKLNMGYVVFPTDELSFIVD